MKLRYVLVPAGLLAALAVGGLGGAAFAGVMTTSPLASAGGDGSAAAPNYPTNASGLTYGSAAAAAPHPENEPDLILVVSNEGSEGYVYKTDLDEATGSTAASTFRSPDDALAWQEDRIKQGPVVISVYQEDGQVRIGTFTIAPPEGYASFGPGD